MLGKLLKGFAATMLLMASYGSQAIVIVDLVGDIDGLGLGVSDGDDISLAIGAFDNRSAAEMAATDGSQNTDRANSQYGLLLDFQDYTHTFGSITGTITSITWDIGIGGMQSNDDNPATKSIGEDGLFIDGALVSDIFEPVIQDNNDFEVLSFNIDSAFFSSFLDGSVVMRIDSNSNGGTNPANGNNGSPIWYDYSRLTIVTSEAAVPEPSSLMLLSLGLLGIGALKRKKA